MSFPKALLPLLVAALLLAPSDARLLRASQTAGFATLPSSLSGFAATTSPSTTAPAAGAWGRGRAPESLWQLAAALAAI